MIKGLAHVCIAAVDLAAAERFYCTGLGLAKAFEFVQNGRIVGFYLEVSEHSYVEVFELPESDTAGGGAIQHLCIEVDDIDDIGRRLTEHGYAVSPKTLGADQSWQLWTTDPSGVRIEFHQYTDQSCQRTREQCILA